MTTMIVTKIGDSNQHPGDACIEIYLRSQRISSQVMTEKADDSSSLDEEEEERNAKFEAIGVASPRSERSPFDSEDEEDAYSPISSFRRHVRNLSREDPLDLPDISSSERSDNPENYRVPSTASTAKAFQPSTPASPSWGDTLAREIEEAHKAYSIVSDPTGMDDRIHHLLRDILASTERRSSEPRHTLDLAEVSNTQGRRGSASQDTKTSTGKSHGILPGDGSRNFHARQAVAGNSSDERHSRCARKPGADDPEAQSKARVSPSFSVNKPPLIDGTSRSGRGQRSDNDEKKESDDAQTNDPGARRARFSARLRSRLDKDGESIGRTISMTESDVASLDGLPMRLRSQWLEDDSRRESILKNLDGLHQQHAHLKPNNPPGSAQIQPTNDQIESSSGSVFRWPSFNWFSWGSEEDMSGQDEDGAQASIWRDHKDDTLAILGCADIIHVREGRRPTVGASLIRVKSAPPPPSYAETRRQAEVDPRLQEWVDLQFSARGRPPRDGAFNLGLSRTVIVHEIVRGNWTWCIAWSPNGRHLAVGTENHHLAVIDTSSSAVWRVRHDQRIKGPEKTNTTHSIRSIAWGKHFIAIGGTGKAVSILDPVEPYPVVHRIEGTGFVGSLDWRVDSTVLAIASRLDKAMVVRIRSRVEKGQRFVDSEVIHTITCNNWANAISFSPGGTCLALGDASGLISVYSYAERPDRTADICPLKTFTADDSILDIEWSPDGKWLYAGGEDFRVAMIDTNYWEIVHVVKRERWVQCIASSHAGNFMAVGGVNSEISILDVENGWDSVMGVDLKGLVPLSARWHPKDQYLALTGQSNSVLVLETTNARHVKGHHLQSISPVLAIDFSPDGRTAIIGNESGVITFFSLAGSTFETVYELVITVGSKVCTSWSSNAQFVVVGSKDCLTIIGRSRYDYQPDDNIPPGTSGFCIQKIMREFGEIHAVSIDSHSQFIAVSGARTWILDSAANFAAVREWNNGVCLDNAWSPDGRWLATFGLKKVLTIYSTSDNRVGMWRVMFSLQCDGVGRAVAWGPQVVGGLLYLAYGGDSNEITIIEIRTFEGTWETILRIPREGSVNAMDWSSEGLLAAAIGNGTVAIVDLSYLQSGIAVNEMDYNWQRQALTCFTEVRRNRGFNSMGAVRWIPSAPGSDSLLAIGGTDGEVEIIDLTERQRCRGYVRDSC